MFDNKVQSCMQVLLVCTCPLAAIMGFATEVAPQEADRELGSQEGAMHGRRVYIIL